MKHKSFIMYQLMAVVILITVLFTTYAYDVYAGCGGCNVAGCYCVDEGVTPKSGRDKCYFDPLTHKGCPGHSWKPVTPDKICDICGNMYSVYYQGFHCTVDHCDLCQGDMYNPVPCKGQPDPIIYYDLTLLANNNRWVSTKIDGNDSKQYTVQAGYAMPNPVSIPKTVPNGFSFTGYYYSSDSVGNAVIGSSGSTSGSLGGNMTLYAHYKRKSVVLKYDGNYDKLGKVVDNRKNLSYTYYYDDDYLVAGNDRTKIDFTNGTSQAVSIDRNLFPDPVYRVHGYIFDGWWTEPEGGTEVFTWEDIKKFYGNKMMDYYTENGSKSITVYAHWKESIGDLYLTSDGNYVKNQIPLTETSEKTVFSRIDYLDELKAPILAPKYYRVSFNTNAGDATVYPSYLDAVRTFSYWSKVSPFYMSFNLTSNVVTNDYPTPNMSSTLNVTGGRTPCHVLQANHDK